MKLSAFGEKFTQEAGITSLMDDLGNALAGGNMIMMGGGNPGHIAPIQTRFREVLRGLVDAPGEFQKLIGIYDPPQGEKTFLQDLAALLRATYGWPITAANLALTNGSQSAFFILFNLFGGRFSDGSHKQVQLPLAPEYIGYADAGLTHGFFATNRPSIAFLDDHLFKYHVDFSTLAVDEHIGAICVSRPTNPTGNVLTDDEVSRLDQLARAHDVPLIIDGAYGTPFPHLIYTDATPIWNDNIILCLSLSKLGLPAARTGIVVAREEVIAAISGTNAILNLAPGSFGAMLAQPLVRSGEILTLSRDVVCPYYLDKATKAMARLQAELKGYPYAVHKPEGAMFLWLWLRDLPITSLALYQRLKARGVLVVSGHYFFPGLENDDWSHRNECIRITYSQDDDTVARGLAIIADEVKGLYDRASKP